MSLGLAVTVAGAFGLVALPVGSLRAKPLGLIDIGLAMSAVGAIRT